MIRITGNIHVDLNQTFRQPTLHLFLSQDISSTPLILPLVPETSTYSFSLQGDVPNKTLSRASILGIDVYIQEENHQGEQARMRCGSDSIYVEVLEECIQTNTILQCTCHNNNIEEEFQIGTLKFEFTQFKHPQIIEQGGLTPERQQDVSTKMTKFITKSFEPFEKNLLQGSIPAVENIHAPMFITRTNVLPGIMYWRTPWIGFNEDYLEHLTHMVCARHNRTPQSLSLEDRESHEIMAEMCTAFPASCTYLADFYEVQGKKIPFESFDDLFERKSGDCEDLSKAICYIFDHIRQGSWKRPIGRMVQTITQEYIAFSILGAVTRPAFYNDGVNGVLAAHMFVKLLPTSYLNRWTNWDLPSSSVAATKPLLCEGTGYVGTDLFRTPTFPHVATPSRAEPMTYIGLHNDFYQLDVHGYSSTLPKIGIDTAHVTFMKHSKYGVPFHEVMLGDDQISMFVHPGLPPDLLQDANDVLQQESPSPPLSLDRYPTIPTPSPPGTDFFLNQHDTQQRPAALGDFELIKEEFTPTHCAWRVRATSRQRRGAISP